MSRKNSRLKKEPVLPLDGFRTKLRIHVLLSANLLQLLEEVPAFPH